MPWRGDGERERVVLCGTMKLKSVLFLMLFLFAICLSPSCITTTAPDGTAVERVDSEAVNPWIALAAELFGPKGEPAPVPLVVLPSK